MAQDLKVILAELLFETREFTRLHALIYIIVMSHEGTLPFSQRELAERWKWPRRKVNEFLNYLSLTGVVSIEKDGKSSMLKTAFCTNSVPINSGVFVPISYQSTSCKSNDCDNEGIDFCTNSVPISSGVFVPNKESNKENLLPSPTPSSIIKEINKEKRKTNSNKLECGKKIKKEVSPEEIEEERKKREDAFYDSLVPYLAQYGKEMLREFYDYWSEWDKDYKSMRFEDQKKWEVSKRLATWYSKLRNRKWKETY